MGKNKKKNITELLDSVKEILNMEQFRWVIIDGDVTKYKSFRILRFNDYRNGSYKRNLIMSNGVE